MTVIGELHEIRREVTRYGDELTAIYRTLKSMDLRKVPIEDIIDLRKRVNKCDLYSRAISDRLNDALKVLEVC